MLRRSSGEAPTPCRKASCKQVIVWVSDVDRHYARAVSEGAEVIHSPLTKAYGLRQYLVRDQEGHLWEFTQHVINVPPEAWGAVSISPPTTISESVDYFSERA